MIGQRIAIHAAKTFEMADVRVKWRTCAARTVTIKSPLP